MNVERSKEILVKGKHENFDWNICSYTKRIRAELLLHNIIMEDPLCETLLKAESPNSFNIGDLYWSYIANCVFNAFFSYTAIMLNILTIHAMRKASSLPKTLKTLLLSLAVSDLGVGLVVQPFYIVLLSYRSQEQNPSCAIKTAFAIVILVILFPSCLGILIITMDRFLAIHLHLRYQELVTHKRVVAVLILMWMLTPFVSSIPLLKWIPVEITNGLFGCGPILTLIITALLNYKIYLAVRRHRIQIQALQLQDQNEQNRELANFASVRKSAHGTFYVYLVFLFCYLPRGCNLLSFSINGPTTINKALSLFTQTLIFLNSSLNPVIYCWKIRHIRHATIDILRNIFPRRNWDELKQVM